MRRKKFYSKLSAVLALALALTSVPMDAHAAGNLALNKSVTASSYEVADTDPAKAVDGDLSTRWGTGRNLAAGEYIEVNLGSAQSIQKIVINFERTDDAQNILGYHVDLDGETVYTKTEKAAQVETILLAEAKTATTVRVTIDNADGGTINWLNVGINEFQVYGSEEDTVVRTENVNHVLSAAMSASTVEENLATLNAAKAGDGNESTRWSSVTAATATPAADQWLKAAFSELTQVKHIKVKFHTRDVNPTPNNVSQFSVKYTDANGTVQVAKANHTLAASGEGYVTATEIVLPEAIIARDIQLCDFVVKTGTTQWNSIGIVELEAYSNELEAGAVTSAADLAARLEAAEDTVVAADADTFVLPEAPEGYEIAINGTDFEQIIAKDLTVVHPLTDKEVQVSYLVTQTGTGETALTGDISYTVEGKYTQAEGKNTKPVVIPEIQEWYSDSAEKLAVSAISKVTYNDASLEKIVDEFIADYEDFTGVVLTKTAGDAQANAFNFTKAAPDALLGEEGYTMEILSDRIVVKSESVTGNMYGMQTILQMYKQDAEGFAIGTMRDYPRFEVRGFMLDLARKPVGMEMVTDMARTMRYYKMNDFQLHLSDNYIFLENYGHGDTENEGFNAYEAFRLESGLTNAAGESPTAKDYYFEKAEMRAFIQAQRALGMNIVPEIDLPAHATSFTKVWPELMIKGQVSPLNSSRPLIDHFDLTNDAAVEKIVEIFDDYTKDTAEIPATFDSETIVHVGADEFVYNYTSYREFVNVIVPHVKETNTVRMWGGLTWIDDGVTEITQEAIENVQMNLWSKDWADGKQMYDMGYKLINTIDDYGYLVPSGSLTRANSYGDLLNVSRIFESFKANRVRTGSGYVELPSSDDQILGAVYALWNDNIDKSASGLSESDLYYRFFDALPFYAEKTWAATGQEKGTADALAALAAEQGTGPNTNPYYQEDKIGSTYEKYDFENGLEDSSANNRDLTAGTAAVANGALTLNGGSSYVTTPIDKIGNGNELSFDITLTEAAQPGDIIFETTPEYGTHDIRIMEDGKLGFTRELYNYYFDYTLPVGQTVNIKITAEQQNTVLGVNGEQIGEAVGKFIHNGEEKKTGLTHSTFAIPLERIGSATNAIAATIDNVVVKANAAMNPSDDSLDYPVDSLEAISGSEYGNTNPDTSNDGHDGFVLDNNTNTHWHTFYPGNPANELEERWIGVNITDGPAEIAGIRYLPRQSGNTNGAVTEYKVQYKATDDGEWLDVPGAAGTWDANDRSWKLITFDTVEAKQIRLQGVHTYADGNTLDTHMTCSEFRLIVPAEVSKDALAELIAEAESLTAADYTEETWAVLETALEVANIVKEADDVTQADVDSVAADLQAAIDALEEKPEEPTPDPEPEPEPKEEVCKVFSDVSHGQWYEAAVQYVYDNGIMSGNSGLFNPNGNITRAQVVTTLYNLEGRPAVTDKSAVNDLVDVQAGQWYTDAVCWAYSVKVASGNSTTKMFNMNTPVTRQQLATFFYKYAEHKGFDITTRGDYSGLAGADEVASYAADTMKWAYGTGLITGSKTVVNGATVYDLKPTGTATRAQMASILMRFSENNGL